ncbi:hypothetical protein IQ07DRAFT_27944 [Pyrenochaeta sp. DS3sAY3a]|nr:hypothetical protein IQ07DRAFT_27944 [Pyrenochaeta sp. DS3sAY3a]
MGARDTVYLHVTSYIVRCGFWSPLPFGTLCLSKIPGAFVVDSREFGLVMSWGVHGVLVASNWIWAVGLG